MLLILLAIAASGYAAAGFWLMRQETQLLFSAVQTLGSARPSFPFESINLPRPDGARQFAWAMPQADEGNAPWAIYLHGNPSTIASRVNIAHYEALRDLGFNVLAPEYRGFGGLDGPVNAETLSADARAAYDYLRHTRTVPPHRIVVYGWSLGSAVAVNLAVDAPVAALILEGAPASLVDLARTRYPFFPMRLLMRSRFDSIRTIDRVPVPMLFIHGRDDEVVPIAEGRRLFDAAGGAKRFVEVSGGHAAAIDTARQDITRAVADFMQK